MNKSHYKLILILIKYFPIISSLLLWIRVLLIILFNYHNAVIELFVGTSIIGGTMLILASALLHFCLIHKLFIYYTIIVGFCIDFQTIIGWGILRTPMQYLVIISGILLFLYLIISRSCLKSLETCYKQ